MTNLVVASRHGSRALIEVPPMQLPESRYPHKPSQYNPQGSHTNEGTRNYSQNRGIPIVFYNPNAVGGRQSHENYQYEVPYHGYPSLPGNKYGIPYSDPTQVDYPELRGDDLTYRHSYITPRRDDIYQTESPNWEIDDDPVAHQYVTGMEFPGNGNRWVGHNAFEHRRPNAESEYGYRDSLNKDIDPRRSFRQRPGDHIDGSYHTSYAQSVSQYTKPKSVHYFYGLDGERLPELPNSNDLNALGPSHQGFDPVDTRYRQYIIPPEPRSDFLVEGILHFGKLKTIHVKNCSPSFKSLPDFIIEELEQHYRHIPQTGVTVVAVNGNYSIYAAPLYGLGEPRLLSGEPI